MNPGPVTPEQYTARLAEILTDAPTDDIKKILSGWRVDKPRNTFLEELKKLKIPGLNTSVAWLLNVTVTHDNVKKLKQDQLTSSVTTVLESLLPDECDQCREVFHFKIGDKPRISCSACLQGFHPKCLDEKLGENGILPDLPWKVSYLCTYCAPRYAMMSNGGTAPSLSDKRRTLAEELARARNDGGGEEEEEDFLPVSQLVTSAVDTLGTQGDSTTEADNPAEEREMSKSDKTCALFLKGECQFGVKGKECPDLHPKPCKTFMKWGNIHDNGCKNGASSETEPDVVQCDQGIHSQVCPDSMSFKCNKEDCTFKLHILKSRAKKKKDNNATTGPDNTRVRPGPPSRRPGSAPPPSRGSYHDGRHPNPWSRQPAGWGQPAPWGRQLDPVRPGNGSDFQMATTIQKAIQASLEEQMRAMERQLRNQQATLVEELFMKLSNRTQSQMNLSRTINGAVAWPPLPHFY